MQARLRQAQDQFGHWLPPRQQWFTPKEMAAIVGRSDQYIRDCFDSQRILGHCLQGRTRAGARGRKSYQIHREAVLLYLLETANYEPEDFMAHMRSLLCTRSREQREALGRWLVEA